MSTALVIVDVQVGAFDGVRMPPVAEPERLLSALSAAQRAAREAGVLVVMVQDCGRAGGAFEQGTSHWAIHPDIAPALGDVVVRKSAPSAFNGTGLADLLRVKGVEAVVVGGLHSEHCVSATCRAALALGLSVTLLADGHTAAQPGGEAAVSAALASAGVGLSSTAAFVEGLT